VQFLISGLLDVLPERGRCFVYIRTVPHAFIITDAQVEEVEPPATGN